DTQLISEFNAWLRQAGVTDAQVVTYDVGCPSAFATPSDLEQAVLKFRQAGVTHVTTVDFLGDFGSFTHIAQQQGFKPKYIMGDRVTYGGQFWRIDQFFTDCSCWRVIDRDYHPSY